MPTVFFYISGHGFGHAVRQIDDHQRAARPRAAGARDRAHDGSRVAVSPNGAPAGRHSLPGETDTGVVQIDSLHPDEPETILRARAFQRRFDELVARESALLRSHGASLVVADAPPLACAAAAACRHSRRSSARTSRGTGSIATTASSRASPSSSRPLARLTHGHPPAWRLPIHGGFETISEIVDVPLVARRGRATGDRRSLRTPARAADGTAAGARLVRRLRPAPAPARPSRLPARLGHRGVVAGRRSAGAAGRCLQRREDAMYDSGLRYEDLVRAVDVVITKPGYGIISDCVANGAAHAVHVARAVCGIRRDGSGDAALLRCRCLETEAFADGRWNEGLRELAGRFRRRRSSCGPTGPKSWRR